MTAPRYTPNPNRAREIVTAVDAGLVSAAQLVQNDVRQRFRQREGGYTSGAFAHPGRGVSASITRTEVHQHGAMRRVMIGTNQRTPAGFSYPMAWELGHYNIFTRRFERVETFRPALLENAARAQSAFARVVRARLGAP